MCLRSLPPFRYRFPLLRRSRLIIQRIIGFPFWEEALMRCLTEEALAERRKTGHCWLKAEFLVHKLSC